MSNGGIRETIFNRLIWWGCGLVGAGVVLILVQLIAEIWPLRRIGTSYVGVIVLLIGVGFLVVVFALYSLADLLPRRAPPLIQNGGNTATGGRTKPTTADQAKPATGDQATDATG